MPESNEERAARYAALDEKSPTMSVDAYRSRSRRSVLTGAAGAVAGLLGWRWLQARPDADNIPDVLRLGHEANERLWRGLFREGQLAPTFDRSASSMLRVNGRRGGIENEIDLAAWSMTVLDNSGAELGIHDMDSIRTLPKQEITVEHKCVEGWSHIVTWGGVRFSDFVEANYPQMAAAPTEFVSLITPDKGYYVGLEWDAMMHPQTLLCYELQGEPLEQLHGAPLRLVTPLKYGIKQIKRIGSIAFANDQPADYWAERGYDWYAAL